jgi:hypothetical protein
MSDAWLDDIGHMIDAAADKLQRVSSEQVA